jgi:Uncharacterized protein conserved in bacteria (DUF2344)
VERPSGPATRPAAPDPDRPVPTPRQRWRLVLARDATTPELAGRELGDAWDEAIDATGLPVYRPPGRNRPAIAFGAPVPARIALEGELADLVLTALTPTWAVRESLIASAPPGWRLIGLFDVWLGAPALVGQVAAADYRVEVDGVDATSAQDGIRSVLTARTLPRERQKGGTTVAYDLRPLLADLAVLDPGPPVVVRARTRFDPVLGNGRPDEVIAALGEAAGVTVTVRSIVRERLVMRDDPA